MLRNKVAMKLPTAIATFCVGQCVKIWTRTMCGNVRV